MSLRPWFVRSRSRSSAEDSNACKACSSEMDDDGWAAAGRDESHELIIEVYEKNREKRGREGEKGLYASGCVCVRERERERESERGGR